MTESTKGKQTNDKGGERGKCPKCGFLIDTCMYFEKEDYRDLQCPSCKYRACNYGWYPKSFQKAKEEYEAGLK